MSDESEAKQLVRDQIDAMQRGDAVALRKVFTEDARWWVPQSAGEMVPRPLVGRDAVVDLLSHAGQFFSSTSWELHQLIEQGDHIAVPATMTGVTASGNDYVNAYVFVFRFEDGLIAEVWEHVDTAYAFSRMSGA